MTTQLLIEIGYKIAKRFASKSPKAKRNAELLGLMVNDPNIEGDELAKITAPTLVICGTNDMIRNSIQRDCKKYTQCEIIDRERESLYCK